MLCKLRRSLHNARDRAGKCLHADLTLNITCRRPSNTPGKHATLHIAGLMVGHRLQQWPKIKSALVQCLVFANTGVIS